jgi:hypothetical protein
MRGRGDEGDGRWYGDPTAVPRGSTHEGAASPSQALSVARASNLSELGRLGALTPHAGERCHCGRRRALRVLERCGELGAFTQNGALYAEKNFKRHFLGPSGAPRRQGSGAGRLCGVLRVPKASCSCRNVGE